jgi:peptidoglycan hydrolase-like protein with peptidoglycan-binding domain
MAFDKDKDTTKSTGGGYKSGDYGSYRESQKERSTSVGAGRGSSAGGPTTSSERAAASKSSTSSSTGYGESRTSVADRDRQGLGNVASNRPSTSTGYGAGGSRSPGYPATPTAITPAPSTTGLGAGFSRTVTPIVRDIPTMQRDVTSIVRGLGGGLIPSESVISERQLRGTPTAPAVTATRIDPSAELMKLSLDMIAKAETYPGTVPEHGVFGKKGGNPALTSMTIQEVMDYQKTLKNTPVGAFQFTKATLPVAMKLAGITPDTVFSKEIQYQLGAALVQNRARQATDKNGKIDLNKFQTALSQEWAGLANPATGASYYAGKAGNKATVATDVTREIASDLALALKNGAATAAAAAAPVSRYDQVYSGKPLDAKTRMAVEDSGVRFDAQPGLYASGANQYVDPYAAVRQPAAAPATEGPSVRESVRDDMNIGERERLDRYAGNPLPEMRDINGNPIGPGAMPPSEGGAAERANSYRGFVQSLDDQTRQAVESSGVRYDAAPGLYRDPAGFDTYARNQDRVRPVPAAAETTTTPYDLETPEGIKEFQRDQGLPADGIIGPQTRAMIESLIEPVSSSDYDFNTKEGIKEFQRDMGLKVDGIIGPRTQEAIDNLPSEGDVDPMTTGAVATPAAIPDLATAPKAKFDLAGRVMPKSTIVDRVTASVHAALGPGYSVRARSGHRGPGGSGRHNNKALDYEVVETATGRVLDYHIAEDAMMMDRVVLTGAGLFGLRGTGIGKNYMGGNAIHSDIYTDLRPKQDNEWEAMNRPEMKQALADARASYAAGEAYNIDAAPVSVYTDGPDTPEDAAAATEAAAEKKTAAATETRAANAHPPANTTTGLGGYSNIAQRGLGTNLKPTIPPTGVSADDYKRGLGGDIVGGIIDMAIGGSIPGLVMQAGSLLLTGDTVGGAAWDQMHGQGATNYYQPGDLDRQSDSSGEQVRTDPTRRFEDKYLTGSTASTGTASSPKTTTADPVVTEVPFNDPTVRPKPYEKWGSPTWGKEYA